MSQIGRKEILIPEKVSVNIESNFITVKGPLGELSLNIKDGIKVICYEDFIKELSIQSGHKVQQGKFGSDMQVSLINDGPLTIIIDTKNRHW